MFSKNTAYMSRLDHLRFFAALLVFTYHWHAWKMLQSPLTGVSLIREGEIGVSLFMVLSGFIFMHISFGKQISYKRFLYNRFVRIYPLFLFVLFIDAYSNHRSMTFLSFLQFVTPVGNLHADQLPKFGQMWTVAVEFQFYLIFPFLVAFVARYGARYLLGVILMATIVRTIVYLHDGSAQDIAYWTILGRIDQFCVGMLAAILYSRRPRIFSSPLLIPVAVGSVYLWVFVFEKMTGGGFYGADSSARVAWIFSPTLEGLVWAFASLTYIQQQWAMPKAIDRPLSLLGATSFSIYAWHAEIIQLFWKYQIAQPFHSWFQNFAFLVFPTVIAVSLLSYFIIEKPFLSLRKVYVSPKERSAATNPVVRIVAN